MKEYVLLSKRTGQLIIGVRIVFCDNLSIITTAVGDDKPWTVSLRADDHYDGWIVQVPQATQGWMWMNRVFVEKEFENLGEL